MTRLVVMLFAAGCSYRPVFHDCEIACAAASDCQAGDSCGDEGLCRSAGATQSCRDILGDAGIGIDGRDGTPGCSGSAVFEYTGKPQMFTRPDCVRSITVDVYGAAGGLDNDGSPRGPAALGGRVQGTLAIAASDAITVFVGGVGGDAMKLPTGAIWLPGGGGFNGGASGTGGVFGGGGGGGASDIRIGGMSLADRVFVAGGGGGGGECVATPELGGDGGGLVGQSAASCMSMMSGTGTSSSGGSQTAGGTGGTFPSQYSGSPGTSGAGGAGAMSTVSGGGGGGYFGGGGGAYNGGAGGSSYADPAATGVVHTQGVRAGAGRVVISY